MIVVALSLFCVVAVCCVWLDIDISGYRSEKPKRTARRFLLLPGRHGVPCGTPPSAGRSGSGSRAYRSRRSWRSRAGTAQQANEKCHQHQRKQHQHQQQIHRQMDRESRIGNQVWRLKSYAGRRFTSPHSLSFGRTEPAVWINFQLFS